ncbi:MAG: hypothetical protein Q4D91_07090 [Lautropia sp.]|nr:hypothetical protein [Lautropia sp.]
MNTLPIMIEALEAACVFRTASVGSETVTGPVYDGQKRSGTEIRARLRLDQDRSVRRWLPMATVGEGIASALSGCAMALLGGVLNEGEHSRQRVNRALSAGDRRQSLVLLALPQVLG